MNSSSTTQIQTFMDAVVRPAFVDLEATLTAPERSIAIVTNTESATGAVAAAVRQMHPEIPYLCSTQSPSSPTQTWIAESLYIEILQNPDAERLCLGQYCH